MELTKVNTQLLDKSYNKSKSSTYKLFLEISFSGIKQLILDTTSNTFIGFEEIVLSDISNDFTLSKELENHVNTNELIKETYKSINISFVNNRATLVPNAIFKSDQLENYHHFNFLIQEDDKFYEDKLINLSAHNVFSISENLTIPFGDLKQVKYTHFSSPLIEAALTDAKVNKVISSIYVNVHPKSFQVILIKNQKLELYNSFNYTTPEDFIYYLLFVLDQLNINNEEATLHLSGEIIKNSELYNLLYKYVKTLSFINPSSSLKKSYIFEETPKHFHFGLFNLFLCE